MVIERTGSNLNLTIQGLQSDLQAPSSREKLSPQDATSLKVQALVGGLNTLSDDLKHQDNITQDQRDKILALLKQCKPIVSSPRWDSFINVIRSIFGITSKEERENKNLIKNIEHLATYNITNEQKATISLFNWVKNARTISQAWEKAAKGNFRPLGKFYSQEAKDKYKNSKDSNTKLSNELKIELSEIEKASKKIKAFWDDPNSTSLDLTGLNCGDIPTQIFCHPAFRKKDLTVQLPKDSTNKDLEKAPKNSATIKKTVNFTNIDTDIDCLNHWKNSFTSGTEKDNAQKATSRILSFLQDPNATSLNLSGLNLTSLPDEVFNNPEFTTRLDTLKLNGNSLNHIPEAFYKKAFSNRPNVSNAIKTAESEITIRNNSPLLNKWATESKDSNAKIASQLILDFIKNSRATTLDLSNLELTSLPDEVFNDPRFTERLNTLHLKGNNLNHIPNAFLNTAVKSPQVTTELNDVYNMSLLGDWEKKSNCPNAKVASKRILDFLEDPKATSLNLYNLNLTSLPDKVFNDPRFTKRLNTLYLQLNYLDHIPQAFYNKAFDKKQQVVHELNTIVDTIDTKYNISLLTKWADESKSNCPNAEVASQRILNFINDPKPTTLDLSKLDLTSLPDEVFNDQKFTTKLQNLKLEGNNLDHIPEAFYKEEFSNRPNVTDAIKIAESKIKESKIKESKITESEIAVKNNSLLLEAWETESKDPNAKIASRRILAFLEDPNATTLDLFGLHLTSLPDEVFNDPKFEKRLQDLRFRGNYLEHLPKAFYTDAFNKNHPTLSPALKNWEKEKQDAQNKANPTVKSALKKKS